jgi:hypothetical protein
VLGSDGKIYGVTHPDEFPFSGVLMNRFKGKSDPTAFAIWPRMQHKDLGPPRTGKTFVLEQGFGMAINTGIPASLENLKSFDLGKSPGLGQSSYTVFLRWSTKGEKATATYLREKRPPEENSWCTAERFGRNSVAVLDVSPNPDTLTSLQYGNIGFDLFILTDKGESMLESPIRVNQPIVAKSEPISLSNGDVMYASTGLIGALQDPRNMYLVRICCPPALKGRPGQKPPVSSSSSTNSVPSEVSPGGEEVEEVE